MVELCISFHYSACNSGTCSSKHGEIRTTATSKCCVVLNFLTVVLCIPVNYSIIRTCTKATGKCWMVL